MRKDDMKLRPRQLLFVITAPVLSIGLLGGVVAEQNKHLKPRDVAPYHARAKEAIDAVPYSIAGGLWTGKDEELPPAAQTLLRPNAWINRTYRENDTSTSRGLREVSLLIVQCKDSNDMLGHYPPICYPNSGKTQISATPRHWQVGELTIPGTEYRFSSRAQGHDIITTVYSFLIVPNHGIAATMKDVESTAEDYQERYFGAAQFQVVFEAAAGADRPGSERDEIFTTLMTPNISLIKTLTSGGLL
jgi:hypothetical protein